MVKKKTTRKAKPKARKHGFHSKSSNGSAHHAEKKAPQPKELEMSKLLPPMEKELVEEEASKKKDEFFDEEELKEFSVVDEDEGLDEEAGESGESEPAWDDEEY